MEYIFRYFFSSNRYDKEIIIDSDNEKNAVLKMLDILSQQYGLDKMRTIEFSCLKPNGKFFTDDDKQEEKKLILMGC